MAGYARADPRRGRYLGLGAAVLRPLCTNPRGNCCANTDWKSKYILALPGGKIGRCHGRTLAPQSGRSVPFSFRFRLVWPAATLRWQVRGRPGTAPDHPADDRAAVTRRPDLRAVAVEPLRPPYHHRHDSYAAFFAADYFLLSRDFLAATWWKIATSLLAVMKILTAKSNRDYLYTAVIAFLELLAAAILSINFNFFLFLALYMLFAIAALTSSEIRRSIERSTVTVRSGSKSLYPRLGLLSGVWPTWASAP